MSQQAAIAQKPTKATITLPIGTFARTPSYREMMLLEENVRQLRIECFKWEQTVMKQSDVIKDLRNQLLSLK